MPHGAPALHTWKVDMMGESLPGGKKKEKRKKLDIMKACNSTHTVHTFTAVTRMYGGMDVKLFKYPKIESKTSPQKQKQIKSVAAGVLDLSCT